MIDFSALSIVVVVVDDDGSIITSVSPTTATAATTIIVVLVNVIIDRRKKRRMDVSHLKVIVSLKLDNVLDDYLQFFKIFDDSVIKKRYMCKETFSVNQNCYNLFIRHIYVFKIKLRF